MTSVREHLDRMGVPDWRLPTRHAGTHKGECPPWLYETEDESSYWSSQGFGAHKQEALVPPQGLDGVAYVGHRITGHVNVDTRLAPTIRALWDRGIPTISSCQGGPWWCGETRDPTKTWSNPDRRGYLTIPATHASAFLRLLIGEARPVHDATFAALVLGWGDCDQRHDHPHNWTWDGSPRCEYPREPLPPDDPPHVLVTVQAEFPHEHLPEIERRARTC